MPRSLPRTILHVAAVVVLAAPAATAQSASDSARAAAREPVHVLVSRREMRAIFPPDTARAWGWSDRRDPLYRPFYQWRVLVNGMDGPRWIDVTVGRMEEPVARYFPSLEDLIEAASAGICRGVLITQCVDSGMRASVEGGRVVITLRDSTQIARLFGLRPPYVRASLHRPEEEEEDRLSLDSVPVEYVSPLIPIPDSATRADGVRSWRRWEESTHEVSRYIAGDHSRWGPLWLVVGDSVGMFLDEMHCVDDLCSGGSTPLSDSGWTILDPRVARLHPAVPAIMHRDKLSVVVFAVSRPTTYVKALRPGRTKLRVLGVHGISDTAASWRPPESVLEREVVVTRPIGRVAITPRPDTVRAGESLTLRVRVVDRAGREIERLPVRLEVLDGNDRQVDDASVPVSLKLRSPGRTRIVASLGAHSDTLAVTVVDSVAPESRPR